MAVVKKFRCDACSAEVEADTRPPLGYDQPKDWIHVTFSVIVGNGSSRSIQTHNTHFCSVECIAIYAEALRDLESNYEVSSSLLGLSSPEAVRAFMRNRFSPISKPRVGEGAPITDDLDSSSLDFDGDREFEEPDDEAETE